MSAGLDLEMLYREYGHIVLRRARQILGSAEEAEDVLQELFTSLVAEPQQFAGRCAPSTFFYAATTNACLTRLRNQRNRRRLIDEQVQPWSTDLDPRSPEAGSAVRGVLSQLTHAEARAVVYYYLDGMTHAEIAKEVLGCSARQVCNLLQRVSRRFVKRKEAS